MTIEEINLLTIEDVELVLLERLEVEEATQAELEAELEAYKAELIAAEEARLAEVARIQDLKDRYAALSDKGLIQGSASLSNPDAYFRDDILGNSDHIDAESKLANLESLYQAAQTEIDSNAWYEARKAEYSKIDNMFLEALAEKENGDSTKMDEYLALRAQIKLDHPKPE